ncbi:MAG: translation initiation factor IF-2 associated domain-containing protein, partial [Caulobacteraceae bacterium]
MSAGVVKQSFSHGRSKTVVVETKRRRLDAPGNLGAGGPGGPSAAEKRVAFDVRGPATPSRPATPAGEPSPAGGLSEDERRARQRVIEAARAQQTRTAAEREARARAAEAARRREAEVAAPSEEPSPPAPADLSEVASEPGPPETARSAEPTRAAMVQTRTYEPGRERRDDRISTTTYRPERPVGDVAFNQR